MLPIKFKSLIFNRWWIILAGLILLIRLPALFEPLTYGDEGIYLALGQALRKGLVFYRDIHDNKPPMIYILAGLTGDFGWYRLLAFWWGWITIWAFYLFSRIIFTNKKPAIIIAVTVFALTYSWPMFEGNIANAENFMLLPIIGGFYLLLKNQGKTKFWWWSGILFGLATLFKVPAAFDLPALMTVIALTTKEKLNGLILKFVLLLSGFSAPIILSLGYYQFHNAGLAYFKAALAQNLPYLSSWATGSHANTGLPIGLLVRGTLLLVVLAGLFWKRRQINFPTILVLVWFGFSLFAALLSNRPYPHYLIQILPPLSLSFGLLVNSKKQKLIPLFLTTVIAVLLITKFWHYPTISYYRNFYIDRLIQRQSENYNNYFNPDTNTIYQVAKYIKNHSQPTHKIFVWGDQPAIYVLADRLPASRYIVAYHIVDFNGFEETIGQLQTNRPQYIVLTNKVNKPYPALYNLISQIYLKEKQIGEWQIFRIINDQTL